jgi:hypothetical protein
MPRASQAQREVGRCTVRGDDGRTCGAAHPSRLATRINDTEWCCSDFVHHAMLTWTLDDWTAYARVARANAQVREVGPLPAGPSLEFDPGDTTGRQGLHGVEKWIAAGRPSGPPTEPSPLELEALRRSGA